MKTSLKRCWISQAWRLTTLSGLQHPLPAGWQVLPVSTLPKRSNAPGDTPLSGHAELTMRNGRTHWATGPS